MICYVPKHEGDRPPWWATLALFLVLWWGILRDHESTNGGEVTQAGFFVMMLISLLTSAAAMALAEVIQPKKRNQDLKPSGRGEFRFPTATEDRVVPLLWGKCRLAGPNVVWWGDLRHSAIKTRTGVITKKSQITGYKYHFGMQLALCKTASGAATGPTLHRVFVGDKVLHDTALAHGVSTYINKPDFFGGTKTGGAGGIQGNVTYHDGRVSQTANTYLAQHQNPICPQRGSAYLVFEGGYHGTSDQVKPWSFEMSRYPDGLVQQGVLAAGHHMIGQDLNPMEMIFEFLVDGDWGMGMLNADVDLAALGTAAETLFTEGNGISLQLESEYDIWELIKLVEEQVDGRLFLDQNTGKWTFRLVRDDYVVGNLKAITTDRGQVKHFSRQSWVDTVNQVRIKFSDRQKDYFETSAIAYDGANQRMQQGAIVTRTIDMPGVKDRTTSNNIAARYLRFLSLPLAKATIEVDRSFWQTTLTDVFRWTDDTHGITDLPMRVSRVNFGTPTSGKITLELVQDIFSLETGFLGTPQDSLWTAPSGAVLPIPLNQHVVQEAPRALVVRDPDHPEREDRVLVGTRSPGDAAVAAEVYLRSDPTDPSALPYTRDGRVESLFLMGSLNVALNSEDANPTATVQIQGSPDSIARIVSEFEDATPDGIGQNLENLILIGSEFIGVSGVANQTSTTVDLTTCYRGLLDSVPADHLVGDDVYLLYVGVGLNEAQVEPTYVVDVQPRTISRSDVMTEGEAKTFQLVMSNRFRRPYPPSRMDLNTVRMAPTPSLTNDLQVDWYRRDFETADEVDALEVDAATLDAGFQAKNAHENRVRIMDGPVQLVTGPWEAATTRTLARADILKKTNGVLPTAAEVRVGARHDVGTLLDLESRSELVQVVAMTDGELIPLINMGTLGASVASAGYSVADDTVDHNFRLEGGTLGAAVEYQLNSITGAWTSLIAASGTTGTITAATLSPGDVIYVRHLDAADTDNNVVLIGAEGAKDALYAVLTDDAEWNQLQAYWSMDESSDGTAQVNRAARFGSGAPALVDTNTTASAAGATNFGNAAHVRVNTGALEHLRIPNAQAEPRVVPTGAFTVTAWVTVQSGGLDSTRRSFISVTDLNEPGPSYAGRVFDLYVTPGRALAAEVHDSTGGFGGGASTNNSLVTEGQRAHIALAFDGTNYRVYFNGTVGSTISGAIGGTLNATGQDFVVGGSDDRSSVQLSSSMLDCHFDEVRVYHRALSGAEIAELAGRAVPV